MTIFQAFLAFSLYIVIIFSFMQSHILLGVGAVLLYTLKFSASALLPMAILLDGYYGAFHSVPVFSVCAIGWYLLSEMFRSATNIVQSRYE
jgi:hypothetical protein